MARSRTPASSTTATPVPTAGVPAPGRLTLGQLLTALEQAQAAADYHQGLAGGMAARGDADGVRLHERLAREYGRVALRPEEEAAVREIAGLCGFPEVAASDMRVIRANLLRAGVEAWKADEMPLADVAAFVRNCLGSATPAGRTDRPSRPRAVPAKREGREILERMAMALLLDIGPNVQKIAEEVGVPRTTLNSWPTFSAACRKVRNQKKKEADDRARRLREANARDDDQDGSDEDE